MQVQASVLHLQTESYCAGIALLCAPIPALLPTPLLMCLSALLLLRPTGL
jgi:hypothetical protein